MPQTKTAKTPPHNSMKCGLFSKKEAAQWIAEGARHVHSSTLGERDTCAKLSLETFSKKSTSVPSYPWEHQDCTVLPIRSSKDRYDIIQGLFEKSPASAARRDVREKTSLVLEELITNSIYHGFRKSDGSFKYARKDSIYLAASEQLTLHFKYQPEGVYLSVRDNGGSLDFSIISNCFKRCYRNDGPQMETKDRGAGLGMYMIFEEVAHLKIVSIPQELTEISCWVGDKRFCDQDNFSFNFFERR